MNLQIKSIINKAFYRKLILGFSNESFLFSSKSSKKCFSSSFDSNNISAAGQVKDSKNTGNLINNRENKSNEKSENKDLEFIQNKTHLEKIEMQVQSK